MEFVTILMIKKKTPNMDVLTGIPCGHRHSTWGYCVDTSIANYSKGEGPGIDPSSELLGKT